MYLGKFSTKKYENFGSKVVSANVESVNFWELVPVIC